MTLPEPAYCLASNGRLMKTDGDVDCTGKQLTIYTADQMREYGAAVAAEKDAMIEAQGRTLQTMMKNTIMLGKDLDDQLRLNSMGSEREYVLAGKVAQLERERDTLRDQIHTCGPTCSKAGCVNRRLSDEIEQLRADAERLNVLESLHQSELKTTIHIGGSKKQALVTASLYQRSGIGTRLHAQGHGKTVRQMLDAMKGKS